METEPVRSNPRSPRSKLTGGQKLMVAGLLVLQIPFALFFYPLAAIFAITGLFVPIAIVLMGVGTLPYMIAMKCKDRWKGNGAPPGPVLADSQQSQAPIQALS